MKKTYLVSKNICLFIAITSMLFASCKSFLDIDLPQSQLTNISVYENYETATSALTSVYANMRDKGMFTESSGAGLTGSLSNYTDEMVPYGALSNLYYSYYDNVLLPSNTNLLNSWNTTYNQIYAANAVFEGAEKSLALTAAQKTQLQGEALFIRAFLHFYLVNLFGDIPYVSTTDYRTNSLVTRTETKKVYELIIADLNNSISKLPIAYLSTNKVRPNQSAAKALLSRVYLYTENWTQAEITASSILNQTNLYAFEEELNNVFLLGSKETIWQFKPVDATRNTSEGQIFIFTSVPPPVVALNANLVNSFSNVDLRKSKWIMAVSNGSSTFYHAYKYKERNLGNASKEYPILFRLTEQLLIRAEARAQLENLQGAREDLNKIRKRAGLSDIALNTKGEVVNAVLQERRWELFAELGHRFFDLKRTGKLDVVLSGIKPGWKTTNRLFPIPEKEVNTNPNLRPQNPGY